MNSIDKGKAVPFARERNGSAIVIRKLFSFKAVAAGTAFRVAATSIANVDFAQSTIIACAVVLTFGDAATDARVDFFFIFIHHNKNPPSKVQAV